MPQKNKWPNGKNLNKMNSHVYVDQWIKSEPFAICNVDYGVYVIFYPTRIGEYNMYAFINGIFRVYPKGENPESIKRRNPITSNVLVTAITSHPNFAQ